MVEKKAETKKAAKKEKAVIAPTEKSPVSNATADPFTVLRFALMSEKSIRFIETHNKLVFIARRTATRKDIKEAMEAAFGQKVKNVNVLIDQKARKKAFITFAKPEAAGEIAIKLGII